MNAPNHIVRTHRGVVSVTLPLKTVSESNQREHWAKKAQRTKRARGATFLALRATLVSFRDGQATLVASLARIAPRGLDDDNLRGALKAVRDGVADALGIDDRDPRVTWEYAQERGAAKVYAVRISVSAG